MSLTHLSAYSIGVGGLYLLGYWGAFDIRVMEYVHLTDVFKLAVFPLTIAITTTALGVVIGQVLVDVTHKSPSPPIPRALRVAFWIGVYALLLLIFLLFVFGTERKWELLPGLIAPFATIHLRDAPILQRLLPDARVRYLVAFILVAIPLQSYGRGVLDADSLRSGSFFVYAVEGVPGGASPSDPLRQPRLIGRAGDQMFFFDPETDAVVMTKPDSNSVITTKVFKRKLTNRPLFRFVWG